jgi:hypothetical protein
MSAPGRTRPYESTESSALTSVSRRSQRAPCSRGKARCTVPGAFFSVLRATLKAASAREARAGAVASTESSVRRAAAEIDPYPPLGSVDCGRCGEILQMDQLGQIARQA